LAGFGSSGSAVELFVQETEFAKVNLWSKNLDWVFKININHNNKKPPMSENVEVSFFFCSTVKWKIWNIKCWF
jgi:hypothetical protein